MERPEIKHIPIFAKKLLDQVEEIAKYHDNPPSPITIEAVDQLIEDAAFFEEIVDDLLEIKTHINKLKMRLEQKGGSYLKVLGRDKYSSPSGSIQIGGKWAVRMPKDAEAKAALFEFLKQEEIFDDYATVNSRSLQSLFMAYWKAAIKKDPEAWVMFQMPGIESPVYDEFTKIKGNSARNQGEDNDEE